MSENSEFAGEKSSVLSDIADDAISILRLNVFIVGVYISVVAISLRSGQDISNILNSRYTFFGLLFWSGSSVFATYTYFASRGTSLNVIEEEFNPDLRHSISSIFLFEFVSVVATMFSIFSFGFGYLDGFTTGGLPIKNPIVIVLSGSASTFVIGMYTFLGILGLFTVYTKTAEVSKWFSETSTSEVKRYTLDQVDELRDLKNDSTENKEEEE